MTQKRNCTDNLRRCFDPNLLFNDLQFDRIFEDFFTEKMKPYLNPNIGNFLLKAEGIEDLLQMSNYAGS